MLGLLLGSREGWGQAKLAITQQANSRQAGVKNQALQHAARLSTDSLKKRTAAYARAQFPVFRSKLISVSALSLTTEGYVAQRQGQVPTQLPARYVRLVPTAQFTVAGLPFTLTGVSSTEQSALRQPMNRFSLQFDVREWQARQQALLQQEIERLAEEVKAKELDELDSLANLPVKEGKRRLQPLKEGAEEKQSQVESKARRKAAKATSRVAPETPMLPDTSRLRSVYETKRPHLIDIEGYRKGDNPRIALDAIAEKDPERMAKYHQLKRLRSQLAGQRIPSDKFKLSQLGVGQQFYADNRLFTAGAALNGLHVGIANSQYSLKAGLGILHQQRDLPVSTYRREAIVLGATRKLGEKSALSGHYLFGRDWPGRKAVSINLAMLSPDTARYIQPSSNQVLGFTYSVTEKSGTYTASLFGSSTAAWWLGPVGNVQGSTALGEVEQPALGAAGSLQWRRNLNGIALSAEGFRILPQYYTMGNQFLRTNWQGVTAALAAKAGRKGSLTVSPQHFESIVPVKGYRQRVEQVVANSTYLLTKSWTATGQGLVSYADEGFQRHLTQLITPEVAYQFKRNKYSYILSSGCTFGSTNKTENQSDRQMKTEERFSLAKGGVKVVGPRLLLSVNGGRFLTTAANRLAGERMPEGIGTFMEGEGNYNFKRLTAYAKYCHRVFANGSVITHGRLGIDFSNSKWLKVGIGTEQVRAVVPVLTFQEVSWFGRVAVVLY